MIHKILIAIDDGAPARGALEAGVALASQLGAHVALLHVVDLAAAFRPDLGITDQAVVKEMRTRGRKLLDQTAARTADRLQPDKLQLAEGDPAEEIVAAAQDWGADLIVIGSDSRGRLAHFLLGSTADGVIRRAPCPVMTVRENSDKKQSSTRARAALRAGA